MTVQTHPTLFDTALGYGRVDYTYDAHCDFVERMKNGEVQLEEFEHAYALYRDGVSMLADLKSRTVKELKELLYTAHGKKADIVQQVYRAQSHNFVQPLNTSGGIQGITLGYRMDWFQAVDKMVATVTQEHLDTYAANVAAARAESQREIDDPQTLLDYQKRVRYLGLDSISSEMWVHYDFLKFEQNRKEADRNFKYYREVPPIELEEDIDTSIKEGFHTKRQCPIWTVQLSERVERDKYKEIKEKARRFGGRWSNWGPKADHGFVFYAKEDAESLVALLNGETQDTTDRQDRVREYKEQLAAERLEQYANIHVDSATRKLQQDRLTNTYRRVMMAESAEADAREELAFSGTVRNIAQAMQAGQLDALRYVRFATQVATLQNLLLVAHIHAMNDEGSNDRRPIKAEDIAYAKFPWPYVSVHDCFKMAAALKGKRGSASISRWLQAIAEDNQSKGNLTCKTWSNATAEYFEAALPYLSGWDHENLKQRLQSWKRLKAIGVMDTPTLRHTLREFFWFYERPGKPDPLTSAMRDLVGRKIPGYFPTPDAVLRELEQHFIVEESLNILEPSAGTGAIADKLRDYYNDTSSPDGFPLPANSIDVCEINYSLRQILELKGYTPVGYDFLEWAEETDNEYDLIVCNPPFEDNQAIDHVVAAYDLLRYDGRIIAILPGNIFDRTDSKAETFQAWVRDKMHDRYDLPKESFKESGTLIDTCYVVIDKN